MICSIHEYHGIIIYNPGVAIDDRGSGYFAVPYSRRLHLGPRHYYRDNAGGPFEEREAADAWGQTWRQLDCKTTQEVRRVQITDESKRVFLAYANDANNWNGNPLVGGNVGGSKEERGNLTQLKKAGLIETQEDEGNTWLYFTLKGQEYARSLGVKYI